MYNNSKKKKIKRNKKKKENKIKIKIKKRKIKKRKIKKRPTYYGDNIKMCSTNEVYNYRPSPSLTNGIPNSFEYDKFNKIIPKFNYESPFYK